MAQRDKIHTQYFLVGSFPCRFGSVHGIFWQKKKNMLLTLERSAPAKNRNLLHDVLYTAVFSRKRCRKTNLILSEFSESVHVVGLGVKTLSHLHRPEIIFHISKTNFRSHMKRNCCTVEPGYRKCEQKM